MLDIANKYGIPVKRVETILLQEAIHHLGFTCDHIKIGMRKSDKKPFCKDCWTIFRTIKSPKYGFNGDLIEAGQYVREPTFLDKDNDKQEVLKLTGPPRKYSPRFKTVNQVPNMKD
jgi:hypothetical protein